ncbi:MAG TPA: GAF domain-containing protein [Candidatus Baltobacteraceae bacterium]|nr:GAF domain-containing protein [Candidatus Baltobacteraceae bacterium]
MNDPVDAERRLHATDLRQIDQLRRLLALVSSPSEAVQALSEILTLAQESVQAQAVWLLVPEAGGVQVRLATGRVPQPAAEVLGLAAEVLRTGRYAEGAADRLLGAVPVGSAGGPIAVLVAEGIPPAALDLEPTGLLWACADALAVVLRQERLAAEQEEALRAGERIGAEAAEIAARYHALCAATSDFVMTAQVADGGVLAIHHGPGSVVLTGYTGEEFEADRALWLRMVDEPFRELAEAQRKTLLDGAEAAPVELRITRKDGIRRWLRSTLVPERDRGGSLIGYSALMQDVTDRKQAEEAVLEHARRQEAVQVAIAEIARELDLDRLLSLVATRAVTMLDGAAAAVFLWDASAHVLVARAWLGPVAWVADLRIPLGEGVVGCVAERREGMLVHEYWTSPVAHPAVTAHVRGGDVLAEPLLARERLIGVLAVANLGSAPFFSERDRTTLALFAAHAATAIENARLHEAAVRRNREMEALLRATHTVMSEVDLHRILNRIVEEAAAITRCSHVKLLLVNAQRQALEIGAVHGIQLPVDFSLPFGSGLSGQVAKSGEPLFVKQPADDPRNDLAAFDRAQGIATYLGLPIKTRTQVLGVLTFNTTAPHHYTADELNYLGSFADHAALALEKAQFFSELNASYENLQRTQEGLIRAEKLRALGQMSAGIAHDLNNMLAAILGQVELLRLRTRDPAVRESLVTLEQAATGGARVVRRLQDFARQRGRSPLRALDLGQAIADALEITQPRWRDEANRRGAVITVDVRAREAPPILGYAPEVQELLTNLILNAVDAMARGGTLSFRVGPGGASDADRNDQPSLFPVEQDPSWVELRVTDTGCGMSEEVRQRIFDPFFTTKASGTGLGMSVAFGIMERHGGRIAVASAPEQGTTVTLHFRRAPLESGGDVARTVSAVIPRTVLVVDDDTRVRQTLVGLLEAAGHTVIEAAGGAAAIALLAGGGIDLVLTDLGMPEVNGWAVAHAARSRDRRLPVVLLTGWGEAAEAEPDAALVDRILGKPVRLEDLLRAIAELTDRPT